jgi:hypothetical protein
VDGSFDLLLAEGLFGDQPIVGRTKHPQIGAFTSSTECSRLDVVELEERAGTAAPAVRADERAALEQRSPSRAKTSPSLAAGRAIGDEDGPRGASARRACPRGAKRDWWAAKSVAPVEKAVHRNPNVAVGRSVIV